MQLPTTHLLEQILHRRNRICQPQKYREIPYNQYEETADQNH